MSFDEILAAMENGKIYFRVHWSTCKRFSEKNAYSAPWGSDDDVELLRGYSCTEGARELVQYFDAHCGVPSDETVYIFRGMAVGVGPDGEDLVVPRETLATMPWSEFLKLAERAEY